jgi:hypothetical protein
MMFWKKRQTENPRVKTQEISAAPTANEKTTTREMKLREMYEHLYRRQQLIDVEREAERSW